MLSLFHFFFFISKLVSLFCMHAFSYRVILVAGVGAH